MSRKIVAGNWKMNKTYHEAISLIQELNNLSKEFPKDVKVIVAPPALYLTELNDKSNDLLNISAQNCSPMQSGAFTGEISSSMLNSSNINFCIIGHSERRAYYGDTDKIVGQKVEAAINNNVIPIFCCGEQLIDREEGRYFDVIKTQLEAGIFHLNEDEMRNVVVAYEPVWAIGTGKTASSVQAQEMHAFIRNLIEDRYTKNIAENTSILYGGSCKPSNAEELFANPDVDGGLIGGAALNATDFLAIIKANK